MPEETLIAEPSFNPALLALKPRQVLISTPLMGKQTKTLTLESEQKALLLRSVAHYLDRSGFSKCFKKLLSEADIEKKELNSDLPDLEEIYLEFLKKKNQEAVEVKIEAEDGKKKVRKVDENASDDDKKDEKNEAAASAMEGVEKVKKEKKKKNKETKLAVTEEEKVKEADAEIVDEQKDKKKKKKKKKSKTVEAESLVDDDKEKVSKKRKRSEPEEKKEEEAEDDEESKRRKKEENVENDKGVQETPVKETQVQENGNVEESDTKSTNKKSGKGLSNSKEPKKPFQRVDAEKVVFTDERLKDNSYWAKDGADSGYGAKAQEVLGQVRGRGFRHEKTKKKRGSYRGGEIDFESHSVKFEYSDDEE